MVKHNISLRVMAGPPDFAAGGKNCRHVGHASRQRPFSGREMKRVSDLIRPIGGFGRRIAWVARLMLNDM